MTAKQRILIVDNYDSFVFNLYQRIGEISGVAAVVIRNDQATIDEIREMAPTKIVISPGPGNPQDPAYFGVCKQVILELGQTIPVLGVCLGHQGMGFAFGGSVVRAPLVMHGKTSLVYHEGDGVFAGLSSPFTAMRYHSLMIEPNTVPDCLKVTARTSTGIIMGVKHREYPIEGVQFHPESIGTPEGIRLLANFLDLGDRPHVKKLVAAAANVDRTEFELHGPAA